MKYLISILLLVGGLVSGNANAGWFSSEAVTTEPLISVCDPTVWNYIQDDLKPEDQYEFSTLKNKATKLFYDEKYTKKIELSYTNRLCIFKEIVLKSKDKKLNQDEIANIVIETFCYKKKLCIASVDVERQRFLNALNDENINAISKSFDSLKNAIEIAKRITTIVSKDFEQKEEDLLKKRTETPELCIKDKLCSIDDISQFIKNAQNAPASSMSNKYKVNILVDLFTFFDDSRDITLTNPAGGFYTGGSNFTSSIFDAARKVAIEFRVEACKFVYQNQLYEISEGNVPEKKYLELATGFSEYFTLSALNAKQAKQSNDLNNEKNKLKLLLLHCTNLEDPRMVEEINQAGE